jgi:hypothetical protein
VETPALVHDDPENPDGNVTVLRGDGDLVGTIDDSAEFRGARATGRVGPPSHFVPGNLLVLRFRSASLSETFAGREGSNATDRFFRTVQTTGVNVSVEGRNHGPERLPTEFALNRSNVEVLHDPANETFTVLIDTDRVALVDRNDGDPLHRNLEYLEFEAVVEIPTDDGDRRVLVGSSEFRPPSATVQSPDTGVHLRQTPATIRQNASDTVTINGTTTLLPGSNLTITAITRQKEVLAKKRVQTRKPRRTNERSGHSVFRTNLTIGSLESDAAFDLVVSRNERIDERRVVVGDPPRMWNTTAEVVTEGEHAGEVAVRTTLDLPSEGFLLVYVDGRPVTEPVPASPRVRTTMYVDPAAIDEDTGDVYVLAMWDANHDRVYQESDDLFRTSADVGASRQDDELDTTVPVAGWPADVRTTTRSSTTVTSPTTTADRSSPTATSTRTPTRTTTIATTDHETSTRATPSDPSIPTPGFGVLVAVVAIVAMASAVLIRSTRR